MNKSQKSKTHEVIKLDDERNSKKPEVVEVCGIRFELLSN
jgi:hypothetical protein